MAKSVSRKRAGVAAMLACLVWSCSGGKDKPSDNGGGDDLDGGKQGHPSSDAGAGSDAAQSPLKRDCDISGETFESPILGVGPQAFGLGAQVNVGLLLYGGMGCEADAGAGGDSLSLLRWPSGDAFSEPQQAAPECVQRKHFAVAAAPERAIGYFAEVGANGERLVASDLTSKDSEAPKALLDEPGRISVASAAAMLGTHGAVVWSSALAEGAATELSLFFDDVAESRLVLLDASAGQHVTAVALGALGPGDGSEVVYALAWVDSTPGTGAAYLQLLDAAGHVKGVPLELGKKTGPLNQIHIAALDDGGAVVFTQGLGELQAIRFAALDAEGKLSREPSSITNAEPIMGLALTPFAVGFAVAYRFLPADPELPASIRVAFTDSLGNIAGKRDLASADRGAGALRILLARDGRMFVAWVDGPDTQRVLRGLRVVCTD